MREKDLEVFTYLDEIGEDARMALSKTSMEVVSVADSGGICAIKVTVWLASSRPSMLVRIF